MTRHFSLILAVLAIPFSCARQYNVRELAIKTETNTEMNAVIEFYSVCNYRYEDLPTDRFAADFGANYFDPNSNKTFAEQIQEYLNNVLKATSPQNAPNYNSLPNEYPVQPTLVNKSTTPVFVKTNP